MLSGGIQKVIKHVQLCKNAEEYLAFLVNFKVHQIYIKKKKVPSGHVDIVAYKREVIISLV